MDQATIFYIFLGLFFIYNSNININKNLLEYYFDKVLHLFNSDVSDVSDVSDIFDVDVKKEDNIIEKPVTRYEDKYLTDIRKLDKEYNFDEKETEILIEKTESFLNNVKNNYKNRIEEIKEILCTIESNLSDLERNVEENSTDLDEESDNNLEQENEYAYLTKEEKINMLSNEKNILYLESKKLNELLETENGKEELLNKANDFSKNFVINLRLEKLLNCYVMETTPQGNVLMIYDNKKGSFKYYSDNTIPYRYLEVVCRKYVKIFHCRPLYVDMEKELELSAEKLEKERKEKEEKEEQKQKELSIPEKKNVFAKFKSYNKEGTIGRVNVGIPPKNSIPVTKEQENEKILLKEKANCYTYEGKMVNFSFLKKVDRKLVDKKYGLTFADFKKIQKTNL